MNKSVKLKSETKNLYTVKTVLNNVSPYLPQVFLHAYPRLTVEVVFFDRWFISGGSILCRGSI